MNAIVEITLKEQVQWVIENQSTGVAYEFLRSLLKIERFALDCALQGLISERKIRLGKQGYVKIDQARETKVFGSATPMKVQKAAPKPLTRVCRVCEERKEATEFYLGLRECKACYKRRVARNRQMRRKGQVERLVQALEGIASCATVCACCAMHKSIAVKALNEHVVRT